MKLFLAANQHCGSQLIILTGPASQMSNQHSHADRALPSEGLEFVVPAQKFHILSLNLWFYTEKSSGKYTLHVAEAVCSMCMPPFFPSQVPPDTGFQWTAEISQTPHGNKMSVAFLPLHGQEPDISKRSHLGFKLELSSHRKQCCSEKLNIQATCIMYYGAYLCYYKLFQPLRLNPVMWE